MTELDIQKLTTEASQALDKQQYAVAEQLQHKVVELLDAQSAHASEIADEIEKLAWIHLQQANLV